MKKKLKRKIIIRNSLLICFIITATTLLNSCSSSDDNGSSPDNSGTDDDPVIVTQPLAAVQSVKVFDYGNDNSSKDVFISFDTNFNETDVLEYRLILSKLSSTAPSLTELINAEESRYLKIDKTGLDINIQSNEEFNDFQGDIITNGIEYRAYILSITNTELKTSSSSTSVTLILEDEPYYEVKTLGTHTFKIEALSLNNNTNELYSPSFSNEKLYKMDIATGQSSLIESFPSGNGPLGGNFDNSSSNYYLSFWYLNSVYRYDENDNKSLFVSGIPTPTGIAFDNDDNMYVSSYTTSTIYKVDTEGNKEVFANSSNFSTLDGLVFVDSHLYSVNFTDAKISKISLDGDVELFATLPTPSGNENFTGYITYRDGYFYVPSVKEIYRISLQGNIEKIAGNGSGFFDGPAQIAKFNNPNGIKASITGDTIFIGDLTRIRMLIKNN